MTIHASAWHSITITAPMPTTTATDRLDFSRKMLGVSWSVAVLVAWITWSLGLGFLVLVLRPAAGGRRPARLPGNVVSLTVRRDTCLYLYISIFNFNSSSSSSANFQLHLSQHFYLNLLVRCARLMLTNSLNKSTTTYTTRSTTNSNFSRFIGIVCRLLTAGKKPVKRA